MVGIAVGTAILPPLSRQVRSGDEAGAQETQNRGLELAFLLTLPAAVALLQVEAVVDLLVAALGVAVHLPACSAV